MRITFLNVIQIQLLLKLNDTKDTVVIVNS